MNEQTGERMDSISITCHKLSTSISKKYPIL